MNIKKLLDKGIKVSKGFRFGQTSKSDKAKRQCPKCSNTLVIFNGITKEYTCSKCGFFWKV